VNGENCRNETAGGGPLAIAIERREWERILLHMFVALAEGLRADPDATIDDLLALLEGEGGADGR
jgi:hypothetical protein